MLCTNAVDSLDVGLGIMLRRQVDQPLCGDCCAKIQKDVEASVRDAEREIEAYQAALRRLSAAEETAMPDEEFRRQLAAAEEEEEQERCYFAGHCCCAPTAVSPGVMRIDPCRLHAGYVPIN